MGGTLVKVLPAYAGMIRVATDLARRRRRAPRVCGDDPTTRPFLWRVISCSPRMRG